MIKKLTVNGITETISNAELHVEEENEKEGVLVFNGEVFGENIEKISRIKIGDKFYALSGASEETDVPSSGVELFNIAELVEMAGNYNDINYANGEDSYKEYRCNQSGYGQMILDAFNAGKKIVYIGKTGTWTGNSCSFCQEAFYVGDLDTFNESDRFPNLQYVMVLFHNIQWNSEGKLYKPYTLVFKFPK